MKTVRTWPEGLRLFDAERESSFCLILTLTYLAIRHTVSFSLPEVNFLDVNTEIFSYIGNFRLYRQVSCFAVWDDK